LGRLGPTSGAEAPRRLEPASQAVPLNYLDFKIIDAKMGWRIQTGYSKMDSSGVHLWLVLWKAFDALREHAERHIHSLGIGLSDFGVLEALFHKGPMPVNTVGSLIGLTSGSMTAAVDRLERKGLVERVGDPNDRRARVLHLTESGRNLIACAFADHEAAMERAASGLTAAERDQAIALLKKLGLRAQALAAEGSEAAR
jgi:MarR family 2-MHQ and catechol resistance regulon transcriptional repressor